MRTRHRLHRLDRTSRLTVVAVSRRPLPLGIYRTGPRIGKPTGARFPARSVEIGCIAPACPRAPGPDAKPFPSLPRAEPESNLRWDDSLWPKSRLKPDGPIRFGSICHLLSHRWGHLVRCPAAVGTARSRVPTLPRNFHVCALSFSLLQGADGRAAGSDRVPGRTHTYNRRKMTGLSRFFCAGILTFTRGPPCAQAQELPSARLGRTTSTACRCAPPPGGSYATPEATTSHPASPLSIHPPPPKRSRVPQRIPARRRRTHRSPRPHRKTIRWTTPSPPSAPRQRSERGVHGDGQDRSSKT